jgi:hypothetical protein
MALIVNKYKYVMSASCVVEHSTAQYSTTQHSIAQHSTDFRYRFTKKRGSVIDNFNKCDTQELKNYNQM